LKVMRARTLASRAAVERNPSASPATPSAATKGADCTAEKEFEMAIKISEYRSKKFYKLGAKLVDVEVMLDELSRVHGCSDKDNEHLETARRYAMKTSVHVLSEVVWELNMEHLARLSDDPEWQTLQAQGARQIMEEYEKERDAEFHKLSAEEDDAVQ
jgi:hypothetical protein